MSPTYNRTDLARSCELKCTQRFLRVLTQFRVTSHLLFYARWEAGPVRPHAPERYSEAVATPACYKESCNHFLYTLLGFWSVRRSSVMLDRSFESVVRKGW